MTGSLKRRPLPGQVLDGRGKRADGFTLVELAIAIAVISILSVVALPGWFEGNQRSVQRVEEGTVGSIRTGIHLYGNESLVVDRDPVYPPLLDTGPLGPATPAIPFFTQVLLAPVTDDWVKEGPLAYRGPTGTLYQYNPADGTFGPGQGTAVAADPSLSPFGRVLQRFGTIIFYDSGAIVDTASSLAYIPDYESGTVDLTLFSGASIQTFEDGSAIITLPSGDEYTVADVFGGGATFNLTGEPLPGWDMTTRSLGVGYGQAWESEHSTRYDQRSSSYDRETGTYHFETVYDMQGQYSGGSLNTDYGMVYETDYRTDRPTSIDSTWHSSGGGSYEGSTAVDYQYASDSIYAYNSDQGGNQSGFGGTSTTDGTYRTDYAYDSRTGDYESRSTGRQAYNAEYDRMNASPTTYADDYDYESTYRHNNRSRNYEGTVRYRHRDGRDESYEYRYNHATGSYEMTHRDNNTGEERRYGWNTH